MRPALFLPACPTDMPVRKPKDGPNGPIFFKAYRAGEFRRLSNLFGPVEWAFQRQKFKQDTAVYDWLNKGEVWERHGLWDPEQFDEVRTAMKAPGKLESYITPEGHIASGILAKRVSAMVTNPTGDASRHVLKFILGLKKLPTPTEAEEYVKSVLNPPLSDQAKELFMEGLLMDKFKIPEYRQLLVSTGTRDLHEQSRGGKPNEWEYYDQPEEKAALGFSNGGDLLGRLMTRVRARLHSPVSNLDPDSDDDVPLAHLARRQRMNQ